MAGLAASCAAYLLIYRTALGAELGQLVNLAATLAASLPFAFMLFRSQRASMGQGLSHRHCLMLLLLGAAALRLCLPWDGLAGTDDAYRYLWDGRVQASGINPFAHAPDAPALEALRDERFWPNIYRPDMRTVYPGLSQLWFLVAYLVHPGGFIGLKLVLLLNDLAAVWLLYTLLRRRGITPLRAAGYAWSPLPVVQLFAGGHLDGLMVPWLLLCVLMAEQDKLGWAGAALGAATQVRPVAVLAAPALALRRPLRETWLAGCGFVAAFSLLLLPYARAGALMLESLLVYANHWRFNGSLFQLAEGLFGRRRVVRRSLYGVVAGASLGAAWLPVGVHGRMLAALGAYFMLAPTVYPWYLLGCLGLGALYGGPLVAAGPLLVTLSDLVFLVKALGGKWQLPTHLLWLEYAGIYGLLTYQLLTHRRRNK